MFIRSIPSTLLMLAAATLATHAVAQPSAKTLRFSGYTWEVRDQGKSGPGPNAWDPKNVWVDDKGNLHLKITRVKGVSGDEWHCAELTSKEKFGFGQYEFQTLSRVDRFDRNVVLGLFDYPTYGEDPDGTNEIDIEFARWGNDKYPNGNFTIYPAAGKRGNADSFTFPYTLPQTLTDEVATHRFTRTAKQVALATFTGTRIATTKSITRWTYAPTDPRLIPQKSLAVHLNLWLFQGKPPVDGKDVEVIIKKFTFTPNP